MFLDLRHKYFLVLKVVFRIYIITWELISITKDILLLNKNKYILISHLVHYK